jgi:hypothetical protein
MKSFRLIAIAALLSIACTAKAQNTLLPSKYFGYEYALKSQTELDSFALVLYSCWFICDSEKVSIEDLVARKKLHCYLDVMAQCRNVKVFYNDEWLKDYKADFLYKINCLRKFEPLKKLDSIWYEYYLDTLNNVPYVRQYSGYLLCMKAGELVVKQRIAIPISAGGQFLASDYKRTHEDYISKAVNKFLALTGSDKRLGVYSNPLFWDETTKTMLDHDGIGYCFFNESQVRFYKSFDYLNEYNHFELFYTSFDDYNFNGDKAIDIHHIINANLMWLYDEPTQRSIIRMMKDNYYEDLYYMLAYTRIINSSIPSNWGVWPDVYEDILTDMKNYCLNKIEAKVIYDSYPQCKTDSFLFKVAANGKIYSGKYKCGKELDYSFLKLLYDIAHDAISDRVLYFASINHYSLAFVMLNETEKNYIIENNVFTLYDEAAFK